MKVKLKLAKKCDPLHKYLPKLKKLRLEMALPSNYTQKLLMISQELMKIFSRLKGTFTLAKNIRPKRKSKIARNPWTLSCKVPLPSRLTEAKELLKRLTKFESKA